MAYGAGRTCGGLVELRTAAHFLVERLRLWKADRIFGYSSDGTNPLLGALRRSGSPEFIQARHEEAAGTGRRRAVKEATQDACRQEERRSDA